VTVSGKAQASSTVGFNIIDGRLVPNTREQAAKARMTELRAVETPLREISATIAAEFKKVMTHDRETHS